MPKVTQLGRKWRQERTARQQCVWGEDEKKSKNKPRQMEPRVRCGALRVRGASPHYGCPDAELVVSGIVVGKVLNLTVSQLVGQRER